MSETRGNVKERSKDMLCRTVAKGISEIVRYSLDEDFRKKAFKTLKVESSSEMENKIYEELSSRDEWTLDEPLSSSDSDTGNQAPAFSSHSNTAIADTQKSDNKVKSVDIIYSKNWLQMSIKRRHANMENLPKQNNEFASLNHSEKYTSNNTKWDFHRYSQ